jgi:diguanylate cyclase (GGDEF)-like protein
MTSSEALSEESRHEVRRIVLVSRAAGVLIAVALAAGSLAIHWHDPSSQSSIAQLATVFVGLGAFITISTLSRIGHARVLERSLLEVSELSERLRDLSERDPLTGLYNLRAFYEAVGAAIAEAEAGGSEVSLVVADLDNFKSLNDSFGHQFGDTILIETANVFARCGGLGARAARLGGDEFALLLPGASRPAAVEIARAIEAELQRVKIDEHQPATLGSFGIGTYPADGGTAQLLFAAADTRMYGEKHRRKTASLSALGNASWKVFVRAGRALGAGYAAEEALRAVAAAAREEFALTACVIKISARDQHGMTAVAAAEDPLLESRFTRLAECGEMDAAAIAAEMPGDAWLIGQPIGAGQREGGLVLLAGRPATSFRPDASVVVALADLIQTVVSEARGRAESAPAGRDGARAA